jgi:hypothetical protein
MDTDKHGCRGAGAGLWARENDSPLGGSSGTSAEKCFSPSHPWSSVVSYCMDPAKEHQEARGRIDMPKFSFTVELFKRELESDTRK